MKDRYFVTGPAGEYRWWEVHDSQSPRDPNEIIASWSDPRVPGAEFEAGNLCERLNKQEKP